MQNTVEIENQLDPNREAMLSFKLGLAQVTVISTFLFLFWIFEILGPQRLGSLVAILQGIFVLAFFAILFIIPILTVLMIVLISKRIKDQNFIFPFSLMFAVIFVFIFFIFMTQNLKQISNLIVVSFMGAGLTLIPITTIALGCSGLKSSKKTYSLFGIIFGLVSGVVFGYVLLVILNFFFFSYFGIFPR